MLSYFTISTLLRLTTHVQTARYLQVRGQLTGEVKGRVQTAVGKAVQAQLTFQRADGSFSQFGPLSDRGDVTMTAAVTAALAQARDFVYVDVTVVKKAVVWLLSRQDATSGHFVETGDSQVRKQLFVLVVVDLLLVI